MRIALAQTLPERGDIEANILQHVALIKLAVEAAAAFVVFPELSLTGYEPEMAQDLAISPEDQRFAVFRTLADEYGIALAVGAPVRQPSGVAIGMLIFSPAAADVQLYYKRFLHADEEPYFISVESPASTRIGGQQVALAICYEISVSAHATNVSTLNPALYLASVAKSVKGIDKAQEQMSALARKFSVPALMVNCCGPSGDGLCAGRSAAWNSDGEMLESLSTDAAGILLFDQETRTTQAAYLF